MAFTLDPTKPPDSESPTLGASRIRNVSAFLLQMLGFTGLVSETLVTAPISSVDLTTGLMTLPGKLVLGTDGAAGKEVVAFDQFASSAGQSGYTKLPNGFILQWLSTGATASGATVTLPTAFATTAPANNWISFGLAQTSLVVVGCLPTGNNQVVVTFTGAAQILLVFALGF